MEIKTVKKSNAVIISVKGFLDADTAPDLEKCFKDQIADGENKIIVNFRDLDYISSAGLRVLMASAKKLKTLKGELLFVDISGSVEKVFKLSGFYSAFKIFEIEDEALSQI